MKSSEAKPRPASSAPASSSAPPPMAESFDTFGDDWELLSPTPSVKNAPPPSPSSQRRPRTDSTNPSYDFLIFVIFA
ncbi:MAG: hypothetical protein Q8P67_02500, partial [archaeon]|nr:hypothetical protein [archaeon]